MEELKYKCQMKGGCHQFIKELITDIFEYSEYFQVGKLVNITYDKFVTSSQNDEISRIMEDLKIIYFCLGPDFLISQIKPLH